MKYLGIPNDEKRDSDCGNKKIEYNLRCWKGNFLPIGG
jgi:hypothetical protein